MKQIVYRVDKDDKITFINSGWLEFAKKNGLPAPIAQQVIGTSLWLHISDITVRHFFRIFMARVRQTGRSLTVPFRNDSPEMFRFMEMKITRLNKAELEFKSLRLREENRHPTAAAAAAPGKPTNADIILMCLGCKRIKSTRWLEAHQAVYKLKLFERPSLPLVSHVICPGCESQVRPVIE